MHEFKLLRTNLSLFEGGAAAGGDGAGAAASAQGEGAGTTGGTQAASAVAGRRNKSGGTQQQVLYGKQPSAATAEQDAAGGTTPPVAGEEPEVKATSNTLDEKRKQYRAMVDGDFKDQYTEDMQHVLNRRFKETEDLREQVQRNQLVIDMLLQRYKIADGDMGKLTAAIENDDAYWSEAAEEAGMSVDQYKQFQKLQRENAALLQAQRAQQSQQQAQQQLQAWYGQAEKLKSLYPSFDLNAEVKNPQFLSMLRAGVPVQHAYEVVHMDEIKAGVAQMQARATERQVVDGIRARGARPAENGTSAQSAFTVKDDVSKLTKKDREEIARRAARGEHIEF